MSNSSPVASVIIPLFNQWPYTKACLNTLRKNTPDIHFEVIVVDNLSTDETPFRLREMQREWADLKVISLSSNTGFSPACNVGAENAAAPLPVFLNNDTELTPEWLPPLLAEMNKPEVGMVGPKLVYSNRNTINHAGYVFGGGVFYAIHHNKPANHPGANVTRDYQALLSAMKEVLEALNAARA